MTAVAVTSWQQRRIPWASTQNKKAVVSGGTGGIGLATVKALLVSLILHPAMNFQRKKHE
jgi:hypothetical protein